MMNNESPKNTQDPFLIFWADTLMYLRNSTRADLERFINYVNGFHHALKFTWEISETCVSFLDISVSINGDALAAFAGADKAIFASKLPLLCFKTIDLS